MATNSRILAWEIPWTEGPGRLWNIGSHRVRHHWSDLKHGTHTKTATPQDGALPSRRPLRDIPGAFLPVPRPGLALCGLPKRSLPHFPEPSWRWHLHCLSHPCHQSLLPFSQTSTRRLSKSPLCFQMLHLGFAHWVSGSWETDLPAARVAGGPWTLTLPPQASPVCPVLPFCESWDMKNLGSTNHEPPWWVF